MWLASAMGCAALLLMPVLFRLDGKPHGDWLQFLGRFHPVVVHLPIGLILLVPLLEAGGRIRPALREAAGAVLWLSVPACVVTTLLGFLLAYGGGDTGTRVTHHLWGGIAVTIGVVLCAAVRSARDSEASQRIYLALLACEVGLLLWATHQGGVLTHGDNYFTEHEPAALRQVSDLFQPRQPLLAAPDSFYTQQIQPVFDAKCVSCHGPSKVKGKLRLDSYDRLMRGGQDGTAVIAGNAERSLLFERITLPAADKKAMPSDGKTPLTQREIQMMRAWIAEGASPNSVSVTGFPSP